MKTQNKSNKLKQYSDRPISIYKMEATVIATGETVNWEVEGEDPDFGALFAPVPAPSLYNPRVVKTPRS